LRERGTRTATGGDRRGAFDRPILGLAISLRSSPLRQRVA